MLCRLSYVPKDGGTRTRDRWIQEGTPVCATGRSLYRGIDGCEATVRTRNSWVRARRDASSTTSHRSGREDSNLQPPASDAGALPLRHVQLVLTVGFEPTLTAV